MGIRKDMRRRTQGMDIILHEGPAGNLVGACLPGPCEGSGDGHLSPQGPC